MSSIPKDVQKIHGELIGVLSKAHAPYSGLHVGCAVKIRGQEQVVHGVNVENASYGGTICAERSALVSMISRYGKSDVEFMVIISDLKGEAITPCGMCLQVMNEFLTKDCPVYLGTTKEVTNTYSFQEFLPLSFSSENLPPAT